ncbi:MAG: DEAD/DEAH box helicase [Microthrixaceae bacterium]
MSTFSSLGVPADIVDALEQRNITHAFPVQALTLGDALAGRDVAGKAKTGSGKTLAFGIPMLVRSGVAEPRRPTALALAPTRELAAQICTELRPLGAAVDRRVGVVYGGAPMDDQIRELRGGVDVLVATPGRLIDLIERGEVLLDDVAIVAIDEADRMADLGFLPPVEWLLRHVPNRAQMMLFSATLDGAVASLARHMTDPAVHSVEEAEPTVESMTHRFVQIHHRDKAAIAARIVDGEERTIVFCRTKRGCDRLVEDLADLGVAASPLHGDLAQNQRERALARFSDGSRPVLVATDVAARGIHIDHVSIVVHFNPPQDHTTYLHRSGRTARAGAAGLVVTLIEWDEELEVRRIQRRLGLGEIPQVEMFSNDVRLDDLAAWDPTIAA